MPECIACWQINQANYNVKISVICIISYYGLLFKTNLIKSFIVNHAHLVAAPDLQWSYSGGHLAVNGHRAINPDLSHASPHALTWPTAKLLRRSFGWKWSPCDKSWFIARVTARTQLRSSVVAMAIRMNVLATNIFWIKHNAFWNLLKYILN